MLDRQSIESKTVLAAPASDMVYRESLVKSDLAHCIYLFVEDESEKMAFRILLEEGLGINFRKYGIVLAHYGGIDNLKHTVKLMNQPPRYLSPMIFTYGDDLKAKSDIKNFSNMPANIHLFRVPYQPVVHLPDGKVGGSFIESFSPKDFINACFNTTLLKSHPDIRKQDFSKVFHHKKPYYTQIVSFLQNKKLSNYLPCKIEIAESMATYCQNEPSTYHKLASLIKEIRKNNPVSA
ncbi:hypothetical protein [Psychromonas sp.]|uniref:hypothetical protein n=1 Tax=Psychromonas sp. TaxID=1884585 RepID=UPI003561A3B6